MPNEKFDHKAIEQPRLLDLAGVPRAWQGFQFAFRYALLQCESALMAIVLTAGQNNCRAGNALEESIGVGLGQCFELMDDGLHIGVSVAFGEEVGKKVRHWGRAKGCA